MGYIKFNQDIDTMTLNKVIFGLYLRYMIEYNWIKITVLFEVENNNSKYKS